MLSNVNNYAHWHVHNIAFIKWLCAHGQRILDGMNAEKFLVVFPHFGDGMGGEMKQHYFNMLKEQIPIDLHSPNPQDSPINLRNVLVSSTFNIDRGTNWAPYFKEVFESLRPEYDPSAPRLIYTNRGHARRRGAVNEEELEAALRLLGFSVLEPAKMSYGEQKRCFSNAELIVGGHGGALTNMVYSHRRPSVIELTHSYYGPVQYHWYRHLAAVIGGRHAPIVSKVPEPLQHKRLDEIYFE